MSKMLKWICLSVWLGMAACAPLAAADLTPRPPTAPGATVTAPAANAWVIRYHRSGGIAGTDETWLVFADGRVEHSGRGTGRSLQLRAEQTAGLIAAARSPEVAALNDSYVPANTCCDRFLYEITLMVDGQTRTVRTLDAAPDEPPALTNLRQALDTALQ